MYLPNYDPGEIICDEPDCDASIKAHRWSVTRSGWFIQRDGTAYCTEHIPAWVEGWRRKRKAERKEEGEL